MSIESVIPSSHLILCRPLLLLPPIPPGIRVFSNESAVCMRWPKYWSFSFSISPSSEHPGLIFRMDWLSRKSEVTQSCPTLCDPVDCNLPGSSVHGISRQEYWIGLPFPSPSHVKPTAIFFSFSHYD